MSKHKHKSTHHLRPKYHALIALLSLLTLSISLGYASQQYYAVWETDLLTFVYNWPDLYRPLFLAITILGSSWMVILLSIGSLIYGLKRLAYKVLINGLVTYFAVSLLKSAAERPRPYGYLDGFESREFYSSGYGFPSGHTAIATVIGITLLPYIPKKYHWAIIFVVALVGLSRIYLGVHAPLDVIGGAALGLLIASLQQLWTSKRIDKKH